MALSARKGMWLSPMMTYEDLSSQSVRFLLSSYCQGMSLIAISRPILFGLRSVSVPVRLDRQCRYEGRGR